MPSKYDPKKHHRRSIRLKGYDYTSAGAYFVTIVTYQRECLFGEIVDGKMVLNDYGRVADEYWREIPEHFDNVELGAFIIMPNHIHGIIIITDVAKCVSLGASLGGMAGQFLKAAAVSTEKTVKMMKLTKRQIEVSMFVCGAINLDKLQRARLNHQ